MIQIKDKESEYILTKLSVQEYLFALAIGRKQPSSEEFARDIEQSGISRKSNVTFVLW